VVDTLDEEYYWMGQRKNFVNDFEVDHPGTSQQQLEAFKGGK